MNNESRRYKKPRPIARGAQMRFDLAEAETPLDYETLSRMYQEIKRENTTIKDKLQLITTERDDLRRKLEMAETRISGSQELNKNLLDELVQLRDTKAC